MLMYRRLLPFQYVRSRKVHANPDSKKGVVKKKRALFQQLFGLYPVLHEFTRQSFSRQLKGRHSTNRERVLHSLTPISDELCRNIMPTLCRELGYREKHLDLRDLPLPPSNLITSPPGIRLD